MERIHKIKNHFGMPDYYTFYNKRYDTNIDKATYNKIITDFNTKLQDLIIEESLVYFMPYINLELMLKKEKRKPRIVDGKLINNLPINWKATNELWAKDEEAKEKKLLVRLSNSHTAGHVFRIYCKKFKSTLRARGLYKWQTIRNFARKLNKAIHDPDKNIDAYLLY
tara:strand:+ start:9529 stop:10029 length:501 start_codon:yes stop_codon:yes gene_type:complete